MSGIDIPRGSVDIPLESEVKMEIYPIIDYGSEYGNILCPGCRALMRPLHWHYPDKDPLFTQMYLCTDCGEYIFDKCTQQCLTFPKNVQISNKTGGVDIPGRKVNGG